MTRRGLSPLIATILLIAFAVALGTLIMSWTVSPSEAPAEPCERVGLVLQEIPGGQAICYDAGQKRLRFVVKNTGTDPIPILLLRVVDQQLDVQEKELAVDLQGTTKVELPIETPSPQRITASIAPIVVVDGQRTVCAEQEIEQVAVPLC